MKSHIMLEFVPISSTGRASTTNSVSISTALHMIPVMRAVRSLLISFEYYRRHAKSQCIPSSRLISSLLKHSPRIKPHFFSQKMAQKESKKNIPSTAANAIMRSAELATVGPHHVSAHSAERMVLFRSLVGGVVSLQDP